MYRDDETNRRLGRLVTEKIHIEHKYRDVSIDEEAAKWVKLDFFPLPTGWNKTHTQIMIDIPNGTPGYPQVMPHWFWADKDLKVKDSNGREWDVDHFFETDNAKRDFAHFCIHLNQWQPGPGLMLPQGDSLLSFLAAIEVVFLDATKLRQR